MRLITATGLGAGDSRGHGGLLYDAIVFPLLLKRVYDDKDVQEWIVRSSGLDWTIVRPGLLKDRRGYTIARQLLRPGAHKDTFNLGPPKIEADPQLVLVRRAGHAALSAIKQAIQLRSESTQLRQRAGSGARP